MKNNGIGDERHGKINYRLLGLTWQNIVEKQVNLRLLKDLTILKNIDDHSLNYRVKFPIGSSIRNPLKLKKQYCMLDGVVFNKKKKYREIILEIKLGFHNLGIKELEYLYLNPQSKLLVIFYFPTTIDRLEQLLAYYNEGIVKEFRLKHNISKFKLHQNNTIFVGRSDIGLTEITQTKLKSYSNNLDLAMRDILIILDKIFPRMLVSKDLQKLTNFHHEIIRNAVFNLAQRELITTKNCNILDTKGRISRNILLLSLSSKLYDDSKFKLLLESKTLQYSDLINLPHRKCYNFDFTLNDHSILTYLSKYSHKWISEPDLLEQVKFSSQGELRRRLRYLTDQNWLLEMTAWQLDPENLSRKAYEASFYKFLQLPDDFETDVSESKFSPPRIIPISQPLTFQEIMVILLLYNNDITSLEQAVTIKDIANSLELNPSTILLLVNRLQKKKIIELKERWSESLGDKRSKLKFAKFIYLVNNNRKLIIDLELIASDIELKIPHILRTTKQLYFPLSENETKVVRAIFDGLNSISLISQTILLNDKSKSNRSMITSITKRLADPQTMHTRMKLAFPLLFSPKLEINPYYLKHNLFLKHLTKF